LLILLLGILLLVILISKGLLKKPALLLLVAIAILAVAVLAYYFTSAGAGSRTVADLEPDTAYSWKVIAEDGKGGTAESETRRFMTQ